MKSKVYVSSTLAALGLALMSMSATAAFPASGCGNCHAVPTAGGTVNTCAATFNAAKRQAMATNAGIFGVTFTVAQIDAEVAAQCGGGVTTTVPATTTTVITTTTTTNGGGATAFPAVGCGNCHAVPTAGGTVNTCAATFNAAKRQAMSTNAGIFGVTFTVAQIDAVVAAQCGGGGTTTTMGTTTTTVASTTTTTAVPTTTTTKATTTTTGATTTTTNGSGSAFPTVGCGNCHAVPTAGGTVNTCAATFNAAKRQAMATNAGIFGVTFTVAQIDAVVAAQCGGGTTTTTTMGTTSTTMGTTSTTMGTTSTTMGTTSTTMGTTTTTKYTTSTTARCYRYYHKGKIKHSCGNGNRYGHAKQGRHDD